MAKILLINPIVRAEELPRHVPYAIAMMAALADRDGHEVQVFDLNAWRCGDETLISVLQADDWEVIAAGGITTAYNSLKKIFALAAEYAPHALRVAGGGFLTSIPHDMMKLIEQIDIGVVGEGYVTWPELLREVDKHSYERNYTAIAGLIYRDRLGKTKLSPMRPLLQDLDSLPYPAWDYFPLEEVYFPNSSIVLSEESMMATRRLDINTSYGCSLHCRYCYHLGLIGDLEYYTNDNDETDVMSDSPGHYTRQIRWHSPDYIVNMVKYIREKYGVNFVSFLDENLMTMDQYSKRTWMKAICEKWIEAGLQPSCVRDGVQHDENCTGVHWGGTSHATLCNPEILMLMNKAGCTYLDYGWESFSPQILKSVAKGATPETNKRSYQWTLDANIRPIPNQMIGFPSEDFESIRASMRAWDELGIVAKPFFVTPYPGCEWFTVYRKAILEQYGGDLDAFLSDLGDATDISAVICENFNAVELYGIRELMIRGDFRSLERFESLWRHQHGNPEEGIARAKQIEKSGYAPTLEKKAVGSK